MNSKKALYILFACMPINGLFFQTYIFSMHHENVHRRVTVYSHGFGEYGNDDGPTYPDAPGVISKAVFYTKPAVHTLANYLKKKLDEGCLAIDLEARSCGAGTAINCLVKLVHYEKDPHYFDGTEIKSQADADAIIAAVNNGSLHLTVPLLRLTKALIIATPSGWLGSRAKRWGASFVDSSVVPCITKLHYNPFHIKPLDAAEKLKGHIKCPTLIHFCKQDGVLENPDEDTVKFYAALRTGNEEQTHIYLSEPDDGSHNVPSAGHRKVVEAFRVKYNRASGKKLSGPSSLLASTQPTPEQLRKLIYPHR